MPLSKIEVVIPTVVVGPKNTKSASRASQSDPLLVSNNVDIDEELRGEAMIKANGRTFNSIAAANNYIETFTFGKDCLLVQIETIENCKMKIAKRLTAYAKLATKFFEDGSWRESK